MIKNLKSIQRIIKQLMYVLSPKQKRQSIGVFMTMLFSSGLELLGVSSIYPLLQLVSAPEDAIDKWYVRWIFGLSPHIEYKQMIMIFCILIAFIFLFKNGLAILFSFIQYRFASNFRRDASTYMLSKYMHRSYEFFVNTNSSVIFRGVSADTSSVFEILISLFQSVGELLTIALLAVFLFSIDAVVAFFSIITAGLCFVIIVFLFKGRMKKVGQMARDATSEQMKRLGHAIGGVKEIFVLDRRDEFIDQYREAANQTARCTLTSGVINACPDRILEGLCVSGFILILCIELLMREDTSTLIPVLGSFAMGAFKILPAISKLSSRINNMVFHQFGLKSCYDNLREVNAIEAEEIRLGIENDYISNKLELNDSQRIDFNSSIKLTNISWHYLNTNVNVINGLSLEIQKGESVAFIGSSGTGKTTLADIILGLLKPQTGSIMVDDTDVFMIPHTWHSMIGYVPQSVFLIDDTIRANVAFGIDSRDISDSEVWNALYQAQLSSFVKSLPNGLDTVVGERGIKFSGGQRQRIALARALYGNPEILILDEATSALDGETEAAVMESIEALQGHKTLIIIAHRLSTIKKCDRIFEIVNGLAVERTHRDVFKNEET